MNIKIDKLKLCYRITEHSIINKLRENPDMDIDWPADIGFKLQKVTGTHYDFIYEIRYVDYVDNTFIELGEQVLGTISFGLRTDKDGVLKDYAWLHIDNKQFYLSHNFKTDNRTIYISYITDILRLEFNNVTGMDLAVDSSINFSKKIIRLLRDENYIPIINNSKITDRNRLIEEIRYLGVGNLKRIKEYNLGISQKKAIKDKSSGLSLVAYNKNREIANHSGKEYIRQVYGYPKRLYRLEVRINNDAMKSFLQNENISFSSTLLYNMDFLWLVFLTFLNRIIRFQTAKGRRVYGVLDLI